MITAIGCPLPIAYSLPLKAHSHALPSRQKIQHPDHPADTGEPSLVVGLGVKPVEPDAAVVSRMYEPDFAVSYFGDNTDMADAAGTGITSLEEDEISRTGVPGIHCVAQYPHGGAGMREQHAELLKTEPDKTAAIEASTRGSAGAVPDMKVFFGEIQYVSRNGFECRRANCVNCGPLGKRYIQETEENPC